MPQRNLAWVLLLLLTALVAFWLRLGPSRVTTAPNTPVKHDLDLFNEARDIIKEHAAGPLGNLRLQEGAIRGMAESLDPYSTYYPPEMADRLAAQARGEYSGIGVELEPRDGRLVILTRADGSPAAAAGLLPGDVIVSINGQDVGTLRLEEAVQRLNGPPGGAVEVSVLRSGEIQLLRRTMRRALIETASVRGWLRLPAGGWDWMVSRQPRIAYVRINSFLPKTVEELSHAVNAALRLGATGVILDLRFNLGGQLDSAVECADLFLSQGVIVKQRQGASQTVTSQARAEGTLPPIPLVILVNRFTASSAEVFAGALKENRRALLVGERTWGKGTIQTLTPLSNGGLLKLTSACWYLPGGQSVQREPGAKTWGIEPHLSAVMDEKGMAQMLALRERVEALGFKNAVPTQPASQPETPQTQAALEGQITDLLISDTQLAKAMGIMRHLATQPTTQPGVVDLSSLPTSATAPCETP